MVTLKDVAKDAGVSIATVSCCLSGSRQVNPETKIKIMDSIEKLKYIPNANARSLKKAGTRRIGVILTDIANSYHSGIFEGLSDYLRNHGFSASVAFSNNLADLEKSIIEDFISQNVSGILLITSQPQNTAFLENKVLKFQIPVVFLERMPAGLSCNYIGFDNCKTGYFLTEQLLEKNFRRIAVIAGPEEYSSESEFLKGYHLAFHNYNKPVDETLICHVNISKEDAFKAVLSRLELDTVEAILTTSENLSLGISEALHVKGMNPGRDICLITLGEERWNSSGNQKDVLHTCRTAFTLGQDAAALLLENIQSPGLFEEQQIHLTDSVIQLPLKLPEPAARIPFDVGSEPEPVPLRILMVDNLCSYPIPTLASDFTKKTGIPLKFDFLPQNKILKQIYTDNSQKNSEYDIYMYDIPWLPYLIQNNLISDLTEFVDDSDFPADTLFPKNLQNCRYDNHYYGIPVVGGSQIMFYRKDLFENRSIMKEFSQQYRMPLRPPKTWTEFNGIAEFFTRAHNPSSPTEFGTSFAGWIDEELSPELLIRIWANSGSIWNQYNRVSLNTPENTRAFQSILQTLQYVEKSPFETSIDDTVRDFSNGKTAMLITYTVYAGEISNCIHNQIIGQVGYEKLPGNTPVSIGWNFGMNPFSTKTDAVYSFFRWLCQKETAFRLTILGSQSPVIAPYHSHELLKLYPWMELTEQSFDFCRRRTGPHRDRSLIIPQNKMESIICNVMRYVLQQNMDISQALETAQKEMELLFHSYGYPKPLHFIN